MTRSRNGPLSLRSMPARCHQSDAPPNKRLKLAGGDRFSGSGVLCPWRGTDFVPPLSPAGGSPADWKSTRLHSSHITFRYAASPFQNKIMTPKALRDEVLRLPPQERR